MKQRIAFFAAHVRVGISQDKSNGSEEIAFA